MDHQVLRESYQNYVQGWHLPIDLVETFEKMKLQRGWRSYYQDDHHARCKDERRFGHVKGGDCPDQQQQYLPRPKRAHRNSGSGMQAVFLSGCHPFSHSLGGSAGTGVFLPPGTRKAMEPTRKSGCSTVILPAGVIQALKLRFGRMERQARNPPQQWSRGCGFPSRKDSVTNNGNRYGNTQQKRQIQTTTSRC